MPGFESFRAARWVRTINLIVQAFLFLTLFGGLNYLADNYGGPEDPWRMDLTLRQFFALAGDGRLPSRPYRPIRVVVTQDEETAVPDLRGLLREYDLHDRGQSRRPDLGRISRHRSEPAGSPADGGGEPHGWC